MQENGVAAPEDIQAARDSYAAWEQPSRHLRVAIVARPNRAMEEIKPKISMGIPVVYPVEADATESEYHGKAFFSLSNGA